MRQLDYFQAVTARQLGGYLQDSLWSRLVLQLATSSEPIRHITVALGLLHENLAGTKGMNSSPAWHLNSVSIVGTEPVEPYCTAVQHLRDHLRSEGWAKLEVTLIACILCIGFEWLRGYADGALAHLRSGLQLIKHWHDNDRAVPGSSRSSSPGGRLIEENIVPFFGRLALQASTLCRLELPWPDMPEQRAKIGPFSSIEHARDSLFQLTGEIHVDAQTNSLLKQQTPAADKEHLKREALFRNWKHQFDTLVVREQYTDADAASSPSPHMVEMIYFASLILFANVRERDGVIKEHRDEFRRMLHLATVILNSNPMYFTIDFGVVSSLYFVAINCREEAVRERAEELLEQHQAHEGFWNSRDALRSAKLHRGMRAGTSEVPIVLRTIEEERDSCSSILSNGYGT